MEPSLDGLLSAWAASVHVTDAEADVMRRTIVGASAGPSPAWWKGFTAQVSDVMVRANRPAFPQPVRLWGRHGALSS